MKTRGLASHRNALQLEMATTKDRSYSNKFTSRQILSREIASICSVEFVVERKICARDLNVYQIIHGHVRLRKRGFDVFKQEMNFYINFSRSIPCLRVNANSSRKVKGVADENGAAKRQLRIIVWEVDGLARGLRIRLGR